ncbi:hypothetical protein VS873_24070, partial [Salmonella enterica subsp. enterica serovar Typhi]|nr:hypothetical protein [Salmonella enterica subsp. enterica serovar Typhi]
HKPIMLAGGIGNIRADHVQKGEIVVRREADRPWRPGDHKPIMLAGGIGNIRADHVQKGEIVVRREADRP